MGRHTFSKTTDYVWDFRPVLLVDQKSQIFVPLYMVREGSNCVVNYLDDFCLLGNRRGPVCSTETYSYIEKCGV